MNIIFEVPQGSILGPLLFVLYVNNMFQTADCHLYLYAGHFWLVYQHRDIKKKPSKKSILNFFNVCDWFVDKKLRFHFGEGKTKSILFATNKKLNKESSIDIRYGTIHIKQYHTATYFDYIPEEENQY